MIILSHLSCLQCEQIKFQPKKNVKKKVSNSVVAMVGEGAKDVKHAMYFFKFFNLISLTISNKA